MSMIVIAPRLPPPILRSQRRLLRRRRLRLPLLRDRLHRHEPRVALGVVRLVRGERVLAHLDVGPRRVRVAPGGDVPEAVAVRDDDDVLLGARAQPAADPAGAGADRGVGRGVETGFGRPVGRECREVEPGVLGVRFEVFAALEGRAGRGGLSPGGWVAREGGVGAGQEDVFRDLRAGSGRWGTYRAGVAWEVVDFLELGEDDDGLAFGLEALAEVGVADDRG